MPSWLQRLLEILSPEGALVTALGTLLAVLRAVGVVLEARKTRRFRELERSIPPSPRPVVPESTLAAELEQAHADLRRAQWRINDLEHDLSRTGEDHARTASSLGSTTAECSRLRARVAELEERQSAIDSGYQGIPTHPRTPSSSPSWEPVHVVDEDETPTPPQGTRRPR